jgi:hypothetical protein
MYRPWNKGLKTGPLSQKHKEDISNSMKGKKNNLGNLASITTRDKMSKTRTGRKLSIEHIQAVKNALIDHHIDMDHSNNLENNMLRDITRKVHNKIHWSLSKLTKRLLELNIIYFDKEYLEYRIKEN